MDTCVRQSKDVSKNLISASASFAIVEFEAGPPIVAIVEEEAVFFVDQIRPIRLGQCGIENHYLRARDTSGKAKTSLVARTGEGRERLAGYAPAVGGAFVDCVNHKIGATEF